MAALTARDPKMARAIERVGPCTLLPRTDGTPFDHLARAIVFQQLSGAAASTIYGRFATRIGGGTVRALVDLARHVEEGRLPLDLVDTMEDDAVIDALVAVRGVGRWTAQMFLMFRLGRPDVLPVLDLGVRKGAQRIYRMRSLPDADRLHRVARNWHPWASVASWYCWRALDLEDAGGW